MQKTEKNPFTLATIPCFLGHMPKVGNFRNTAMFINFLTLEIEVKHMYSKNVQENKYETHFKTKPENLCNYHPGLERECYRHITDHLLTLTNYYPLYLTQDDQYPNFNNHKDYPAFVLNW